MVRYLQNREHAPASTEREPARSAATVIHSQAVRIGWPEAPERLNSSIILTRFCWN